MIAMKNVPVDDIGLPARVVKALHDARIRTLQDLIRAGKHKVGLLTGIGPERMKEIEARLAMFNRTFKSQ